MNDKTGQANGERNKHTLEFYIDEDGSPAARGEDQRLAVYLQSDIQGSKEIAKELIALLKDTNHRGEFTGNAHTVDIRKSSVMINAMFDEEAPDRCLPREELQQELDDRLEFISETES